MHTAHHGRARAARAALVAAALLALACDPPADAATPPDREPDLRGTVSSVQLGDTANRLPLGSVRLAGTADAQGAATEVEGRITERTRILHRAAGIGRPGDLQTGQQVSVWFDGTLAESFPMQGNVDVIVIESR